jgi:hypothetical protein
MFYSCLRKGGISDNRGTYNGNDNFVEDNIQEQAASADCEATFAETKRAIKTFFVPTVTGYDKWLYLSESTS